MVICREPGEGIEQRLVLQSKLDDALMDEVLAALLQKEASVNLRASALVTQRRAPGLKLRSWVSPPTAADRYAPSTTSWAARAT